jgi:hypothetical protein
MWLLTLGLAFANAALRKWRWRRGSASSC